MAKSQVLLQEYRQLDLVALNKRIEEVRHKLQTLRSELAIRKLTNHAAVPQARQELARLLTIKQEKLMLARITPHE